MTTVALAALVPLLPVVAGPAQPAAGQPADPLFARQWGLQQVRAPGAWTVARGAGIVIAVVDSGVDLGHPDLAGKLVPGADFVAGTGTGGAPGAGSVQDQNGHGTHIAAIAAAAENGTGIVGVAPDARIMAMRVLDSQLVGPASAVATAVNLAVDRGAQVVNLSLGRNAGVPGGNLALVAAINRANAAGVVVVAAAGNDRTAADPSPVCGDPGSATGVVCVAATDRREQHSDYSNFPQKADMIAVSAPGGSGSQECGEGILSAVLRGSSGDGARCGHGGDHAEFAGSSQATAFVSGVAALLRSRGMDRAAVIAALTRTARQPVTGVRGTYTAAYGYGIVDAAAALGLGAPVGRTGNGYLLTAADGGIFSFGTARFLGSTGAIRLNRPIVAASSHADGGGYWLAASDGGIFSFGNARFFGSTGGIRLNRPIVGMAATPDGGGYWLVASDGGIFSFGNARFLGSAAGGAAPAGSIVSMVATPDGGGYWLVASDGGVFAFGNARPLGSAAGRPLARPIAGMAATPDGAGYWLVASDGGIFSFGNASFLGSTGAIRLSRPIVGMAATPDGGGYWLVASDGGVFAFGSARFFGSTGAIRLNQPIVAMAGG
ncbi:MAG: S8 family serine peptidase [Acidimicrobiales bacterium]